MEVAVRTGKGKAIEEVDQKKGIKKMKITKNKIKMK